MSKYKVGDEVFYKSLFRFKVVKIIKVREVPSLVATGGSVSCCRSYEYLIRFKSGRHKIVKQYELI